MSRKYEAIDLMKLYTHGSVNGWNEFLVKCLNKKDINALAKIKYQVCAGMDDLAKGKLNTEDINVWFVRLTRSLEQTAKKIIRIKHPMPGDNGKKVTDLSDYQTAKRRRDHELQKFMKDSSY